VTASPGNEPIGAGDQSLGRHRQRGRADPHHRAQAGKLAGKYAPLAPVLRELILRPGTPLDPDVKTRIAAQLDNAAGRFAAIRHGPAATGEH
jgi:hypothetical protein